MKTRLRSTQHGKFGSSHTSPIATEDINKRYNPWDYFTELFRVVVRHPFELLGVRMVTSNAPEYQSSFTALWHHFTNGEMVCDYYVMFENYTKTTIDVIYALKKKKKCYKNICERILTLTSLFKQITFQK